jgi:hypothetical protein
VRVITPADQGLPYSISSRLAGTSLPRNQQGNAMTDLGKEVREPPVDELSIDELDSVSGGDLLNTMIAQAILFGCPWIIPVPPIAKTLR